MENKKYLDDIGAIKNMMDKSSRFISLSGLAGVFAGIYALVGAAIAWFMVQPSYDSIDYTTSTPQEDPELTWQLIGLALLIMVLAIVTAIFLTTRKARKKNQNIWGKTSQRLILNFCGPLLTGGLFCFILLQQEIIGLVAPAMLIFYGLSLVNASKYTFNDLRVLGYLNVGIGLIATQFIGYGLYFWALGFGIFHIIYGIIMYNKYEKAG